MPSLGARIAITYVPVDDARGRENGVDPIQRSYTPLDREIYAGSIPTGGTISAPDRHDHGRT